MTDIQWQPPATIRATPADKLELSQQILCTPKDAMNYLSIGHSCLYELLADGSIRSIKVGKARCIIVQSLHDFVRDMESYEFGALKAKVQA